MVTQTHRHRGRLTDAGPPPWVTNAGRMTPSTGRTRPDCAGRFTVYNRAYQARLWLSYTKARTVCLLRGLCFEITRSMDFNPLGWRSNAFMTPLCMHLSAMCHSISDLRNHWKSLLKKMFRMVAHKNLSWLTNFIAFYCCFCIFL